MTLNRADKVVLGLLLGILALEVLILVVVLP